MNAMLLRQRQQYASDNVIYVSASVSSTAALPGEFATTVALDRERDFRRLGALIDRFVVEGFPSPNGSTWQVSRGAAETAKAFLELAKHISPLPKVGTEDDGIVLVWERGGETTLVIVEPGTLHVVQKAGTPSSTYGESIPFDGQAIPSPVIDSLPMR